MLRGLEGDSVSYRRLLDALGGFLRAMFRRRLSQNDGEVEDLVQETLLAIHIKRATYDPVLPFTPWAYGIARYKLLDHYRRRGGRLMVPIEDASELMAGENPDEGAVRHDITTLLARLPARDQRLVRDLKLTGFSIEEAAAREGMSAGAAKVAVHRAMKRLEKEVRDEDL